MSNASYEPVLKGTREDVLQAIEKIRNDIKRYGESGHQDARKHQLIICLNVLTGICRNTASLGGKAHYDLYVRIFTQELVPVIEPECSPSYWKRFLPLLEYLFSMMASFHQYEEACKIYVYMRENQLKWTDHDDFKHLMNVHGRQLQLLLKGNEDNEAVDKRCVNEVNEVFSAMEALFADKAKRCREQPMDCTPMVRIFLDMILSKSNSFQMKLVAVLKGTESDRMFNAFLTLLSENSKFTLSEELESKFQVHLEAIRLLMQMDIRSKLTLTMALKYARVLRDINLFKKNDFIEYCSSLLNMILKISYVRTRVGNFKEAYTELVRKFRKLLMNNGKDLIQQLWFQDFLILLFYLLNPMHLTDNQDVFEIFWQQMDSPNCIAHIQLIAEFVKITPLLQKPFPTQFICCKNPSSWFHVLMTYSQICLETYAKALKKRKDAQKQTNCENDSMLAINSNISLIIKQTIEAVKTMENECTKIQTSIKKFCIAFAKLLTDGCHRDNANNLMSLATDMTDLRSRISSEDWLMIISRVNKVGSLCEDINIGTEILSCYMAEMICSPVKLYSSALHTFIHCYHYNIPGNSLYDTYIQSKSPFKPLLQKHEKRYYQWLEAQYVTVFYDKKKDVEIFKTMALQCQTKYDFVLYGGLLLNQPAMLSKLQNIYELLRNLKESQFATFTRLQFLTLGHACSALLFQKFNDYKSTMSCKDFQEANIPLLLQEKSLLSLSVAKELEMIEMGREAFECFEVFFNKADVEPLPSNDGGFLDWARIVEDLASLATYFQLMGYLDYAFEAWLLHYRISCTIDHVHSSLRGLSFFCEHNLIFEDDARLHLLKEIKMKNRCIINILDKLPQLLRRQQNFVLTCICQIAYYYACQKQYVEAQNLIRLVNRLHDEKLNRGNYYDIVRFTLDMVSFRILWKHSYFMKLKPVQPLNGRFCLLHEIDLITERLRSYVQISSVDTQPYTILLLNAVCEFAEFAANRLSDNFLSGYLCNTLKLCVQMGMAVRTVQLLSKWVLINLQMEYLQKAEIKMQLIESILDLSDKKDLIVCLKAAESYPVAVSKQLRNDHRYETLPPEIEEVRRISVQPHPWISHEENIYVPSKGFDYELKSCDESKGATKTRKRTEVVLWCRFTLSVLRARFNFLYKQYNELPVFYENCEKWIEKHSNTIYFNIYQSTILLSMMHYANFLRATKNYERAKTHLKRSIDYCERLVGQIDGVYLVNYKLQLEDTVMEEIENKTRCLPVQKKHSSIGEHLLHEHKLTPKPSKYTPLSMTTCKKTSNKSTGKQPAPFFIYSDRKSPQKLKQKTHLKSTVAVKYLTYHQSGDSSSGSSSESSAERKKSVKTNLNSCQVIELSDSEDGDDHMDTKEKSTKIANPKIKLGEQKKTPFKFVESIELEDLIPSTTDKKKSQSSQKAKIEIVKGMENLHIQAKETLKASDSTDTKPPSRLASKMKTPTVFTRPSRQIDLTDPDASTPSTSKAAAQLRYGRKGRTEHKTKTPEPAASVVPPVIPLNDINLDAKTPEVSTQTRRLRRLRIEQTATPSITSASLRRRQRN